mgnify:CR=1 FL=1
MVSCWPQLVTKWSQRFEPIFGSHERMRVCILHISLLDAQRNAGFKLGKEVNFFEKMSFEKKMSFASASNPATNPAGNPAKFRPDCDVVTPAATFDQLFFFIYILFWLGNIFIFHLA